MKKIPKIFNKREGMTLNIECLYHKNVCIIQALVSNIEK